MIELLQANPTFTVWAGAATALTLVLVQSAVLCKDV